MPIGANVRSKLVRWPAKYSLSCSAAAAEVSDGGMGTSGSPKSTETTAPSVLTVIETAPTGLSMVVVFMNPPARC